MHWPQRINRTITDANRGIRRHEGQITGHMMSMGPPFGELDPVSGFSSPVDIEELAHPRHPWAWYGYDPEKGGYSKMQRYQRHYKK